ncbi:YadA-like family protein [Fusobacterium nucleatum]|uniref:YadA-like family protein n=1 Tax=Fusobacterium nucleatum TaxID=851 RepID=UPI0030D04582
MKKIVSLKLIIFSLLLVAGSVSYSAPAIEPGTGANSTKAGVDNTADGEESSAFGFKNITDKSGSSAFGNGNVAIGDFSSAFGFHNIANKEHSSAFGSSNEADGDFSSAFGFKNKISGKWSSAFGNQYEVTGEKSGTFGVGNFNGQYQNKNEGNNSYMIGNYNKIAKDSNDNFILGNNVTIGAGVQKSVVLGDGSASGGSNTVSVGSATLKRKIVNVGDGEISANSTDAVTGKQLHGIAKATSNDIDVDAWKAKLGVGAGGVDLTVYAKRNASNLTATDISDWQTKLDVTKKADYKDANDIDVNKWKAKLGVSSGGGAGGGAPVDAYTKSEADNKFTSKDDYRDAKGIDVDKWKAKLGTGASSTDIQNLRNEVYERIDNVKDEVRDVGSLSAALAGLHPMQYDPKAPAQVMAALGHYKDRQAVAVGASYYFNDRFMMSTGVALSGEKKTKTMANVGFTLKLGKGSGTTYSETPQYVVQNEVKRLTVENQELKERVRNLEEKLNMLLKSK